MKQEGLRSGIVLVLLAGLIAVLAMRAVRLASRPEELGGMDERKWFVFFEPMRRAGALGSVRSDLPPGEEVWLVIPRDWDPAWWAWMARYHLPEQRIAGVVRRREAQAPPGAWVVTVDRRGEVAVVRTRPLQ